MLFKGVNVIRGFFDNEMYSLVKQDALLGSYDLKTNPYAGHQSSIGVNHDVIQYVCDKLVYLLGYNFTLLNQPQYRLALEGEKSGHKTPIHTDCDNTVEDRFTTSCIIYINAPKHNDGLNFYRGNLLGQYSYDHHSEDMLLKDSWEVYQSVTYLANTAYIFPSQLFHGPSFDSGFGSSAEDGRLILPLFFRVGYNVTHHGSKFDKNLWIREL